MAHFNSNKIRIFSLNKTMERQSIYLPFIQIPAGYLDG